MLEGEIVLKGSKSVGSPTSFYGEFKYITIEFNENQCPPTSNHDETPFFWLIQMNMKFIRGDESIGIQILSLIVRQKLSR